MTFQTQIIGLALGTPVDLAAVTALGIDPAGDAVTIFVQNVGTVEVRYLERTAAPDRTDGGHVLNPGDGFILALGGSEAARAWIWAVTGAGSLAVSPVNE